MKTNMTKEEIQAQIAVWVSLLGIVPHEHDEMIEKKIANLDAKLQSAKSSKDLIIKLLTKINQLNNEIGELKHE